MARGPGSRRASRRSWLALSQHPRSRVEIPFERELLPAPAADTSEPIDLLGGFEGWGSRGCVLLGASIRSGGDVSR
jgi:hypothetical protein